MPPVRQASFTGGEIAPRLYARNDLAKYGQSARRLRNFFVTVEGAAMSRAGTHYIAEVKDSTKRVRLLPFIYSDSTSYVLEFGHTYLRFHRNGSPLTATTSTASAWGVATVYGVGEYVSYGGIVYRAISGTLADQPNISPTKWVVATNEIYEVTTPYTEADLPYLKFAQSGDVVYLAHRSYAPRELARFSTLKWTLTEISFNPVPFENNGIGGWTFANGLGPSLLAPEPTGTASNAAREWKYAWTAVVQTPEGRIFETSPKYISGDRSRSYPAPAENPLTTNFFAPAPDAPLTILIQATNGLLAGPPRGYRKLYERCYKGRGDVYGLIGHVTTNNANSSGHPSTEFVDTGLEPDYTQQPPQGRNPFEVYDDNSVLVRTERPSCVTFFEQRLALAGTTQRPEWQWLSRTNDYWNFDSRVTPVASDAVEYELASRQREEIRSVLGTDMGLLAFTDRAIWRSSGADGAPLAANALIDARVQIEIGASWLDPLKVEETVLFSRAKGTGVRDLFYDQGRRKFLGSDLSLMAKHLFTGFTLVDWAYAEDPWSLVWAVRSDGKLLSLTYSREQEIWAWTWHDTDGFVESIVSVPETTEDAVYVVVRRTIGGSTKRYIERMSTRVLPMNSDGDPDIAQAMCLDCAKTYSGSITTATGLSHLEGKSVYAVADGAVYGPFTVTAGAVNLGLETGAALVHVGLLFTPELETLDLSSNTTELRVKQKTVTAVAFEVEATGLGLQAGETFDELVDARLREVDDGYFAPGALTGVIDVAVTHGWNKDGRACLRQTAPLPVTVLGVTRDVDIGG